jgi:uncharacterized protein (DUF1501 family)
MLTLSHPGRERNCQGLTRRDFLRIGSLALGGLTLPGLLAARAASARSLVKDRAVVLLFLQGGPSHIELFDPKMTAPVEFRSITGEVQTRLPGVTFGGTFSQMADMADRLAVVRSFASGNADHQNLLSVAGASNPMQASMGSLYGRVAGSINPRTGMPATALVVPEAVSPGLKLGKNFETNALPALASPGVLGPAYAAFDPSGGGDLKKNLELKIPPERFDDRRGLLQQLDSFKRQLDKTHALESVDTYQQQAYEVILRGVSQAFDLSKEDQATRDRYDTSKVFRMEDLQKYGDMRRTTNLLGHQMLLARRLCEAGCGFVTVVDSGWDMHANNNSPKNMEGIRPMGSQVDHAVAAFLEDVHQRGLSDKILLVVTGEMGRSPRINKNGGRDHYANLTPLVLAGGGLKMGQVIGQSDKNASNPTTQRYTPQNLLATVMSTLFDIGEVRITPEVPTNVNKVLTEAKPIAELF